jgi:DNA-3-methyladenine glycosylase I
MTELIRCAWAVSPLMQAYHDDEWGVPLHGDRNLFELLTLEGAQAGLNWETVLRKRDGYRAAFANFEIDDVAAFTDADVERLMGDAGIVRNRAKIVATIGNARAAQGVRDTHGSLDAYLWSLAGGTPRINRPSTLSEVPAQTPQSEAMSRALKRAGFRFVGPTICYAFMQAAGMVDDHLTTCFRGMLSADG